MKYICGYIREESKDCESIVPIPRICEAVRRYHGHHVDRWNTEEENNNINNDNAVILTIIDDQNDNKNNYEEEDFDVLVIDDDDDVVGEQLLTRKMHSGKYYWEFVVENIPLEILFGVIYGEAKSLFDYSSYTFMVHNEELSSEQVCASAELIESRDSCWGIPCTNDVTVFMVLDMQTKTISIKIPEMGVYETIEDLAEEEYTASVLLHGTKKQECVVELVDSGLLLLYEID